MIQTEALRLFAENGYAETTVEEIADAAVISTRTFFRYFPSKEDVVIWDEYDDRPERVDEELLANDASAETIRAGIRAALAGLYRRDPDRLLARLRLAFNVPEVRARFYDEQSKGVELVAATLRRKGRAGSDDVRVRVLASALLAAVTVALDRWQKGGGKGDLLALVDEAIDVLAAELHELEPARVKPDRRARQGRGPGAAAPMYPGG